MKKTKKPIDKAPKEIIPPREVGRPTKYKEELCQLLVDHMAKGYSFESFAGLDEVDVDRDTLYSWRNAHEEFNDALRRGRSKQLLKDETTLNLGLDNTLKVNHTLMSLKMFNCHNWKTKTEVTEKKVSEMNLDELVAETEELLKQVKK